MSDLSNKMQQDLTGMPRVEIGEWHGVSSDNADARELVKEVINASAAAAVAAAAVASLPRTSACAA